MKAIQALFFLFGMIELSSCSGSPRSNAVLNDSGIDAGHDVRGNLILSDTPRMWVHFKQMTDISIKEEVAGNTHWGESKDANEEWVRVIHNLQAGREHPQKHIDYIVEQRRNARLPELVGYP